MQDSRFSEAVSLRPLQTSLSSLCENRELVERPGGGNTEGDGSHGEWIRK